MSRGSSSPPSPAIALRTFPPDSINEVGQRPRVVMLTIDQLEQQGLIEVSVRGVEEVAALTEAGRQKADSL